MAGQTEREQGGRRAAILEQALTEARAALRRQARRHSPGKIEAEEALQEASIDFLRAYGGPAGRDAVRWLSVAIKYRAWEQIQLAASAADPGERVERAEAVERFFATLAQLKLDERTALLLFGLGFSCREICERQGWTYTKTNRCIAEGRAALRAVVE